ncbi:hypothetical protein D9M68_930680 [compost metagenome]
MTLDVSPAMRRIEQQLKSIVYLHKSSGVRYRVAYSSGGVSELHPISGSERNVTDEQLSNPEIWERQA